MMQELLLLLLLLLCDSMILPNVLWQGLEPGNSPSGARDYARSAVASWTNSLDLLPRTRSSLVFPNFSLNF